MLKQKTNRRELIFLGTGIFLAVNSSMLTGCAKKAATAAAAATTTVSGSATLGAIDSATVNIYGVSATTGLPDTTKLLATTTTDANGDYSVPVLDSKLPATTEPLAVQVVGGSYVDETTGATVTIAPTQTLTTILQSPAAGKPAIAAVTSLTDMAYQTYQAQIQTAGIPTGTTTLADYATNANFKVGQAFGITDPLGTLPSKVSGSDQIPSTQAGQYAIAMAALSKSASDAGCDAFAMGAAYAKSLATNGNLVGTLPAVSVTNAAGNTISVTPPAMSTISTHMTDIAAGNVAMAGITAPKPAAGTFSPPTINTAPSSVATSDYHPGTAASAATAAATVIPVVGAVAPTASSCAVTSVVGSLTMSMNSVVMQCTDYTGSMITAAQLQTMCLAQGSRCSFSAQACNVVNASASYHGGCTMPGSVGISRYYGDNFTAQSVVSMCGAQPACSTGT